MSAHVPVQLMFSFVASSKHGHLYSACVHAHVCIQHITDVLCCALLSGTKELKNQLTFGLETKEDNQAMLQHRLGVCVYIYHGTCRARAGPQHAIRSAKNHQQAGLARSFSSVSTADTIPGFLEGSPTPSTPVPRLARCLQAGSRLQG